MDPNYDYSHSFVSWLSPEPLNVPRMALRASCIIGRIGESGHEYFLSCTCAGENMYVDSDIIQQPVAGADAAPAHYAVPQPLPATRHELFVVEQI